MSFETKVEAVVAADHFWVSQLGNTVAMLFHEYFVGRNINWLGFYIKEGNHLRLGPFQGKLACTSIKIGQGVCGRSAERCVSILVDNVHEFEGHIACDSASQSELVVPIIHRDLGVVGVLDIDCLDLNGFTEQDKLAMERVVQVIVKHVNWSSLFVTAINQIAS